MAKEIVELFLRLEHLTLRSPLSLSRDGRFLAFGVQRPMARKGLPEPEVLGISREQLGSRVMVVDTGTGRSFEPFEGYWAWCPQWSADGKHLAAYVQRGTEHACLGIYHVEAGTFKIFENVFIHQYMGFEVPRWTPDGKKVVLKLKAPGAKTVDEAKGSIRVYSFDPAEKAPETSYKLDETHFNFCDLGLIDVETGQVVRLLTNDFIRVWRISPDGQYAALLRMARVDETQGMPFYDLVVVPLNGKPSYVVAAGIGQDWYGTLFNWSPDSEYLAYIGKIGEGSALFVVRADGSQPPKDISGLEKEYDPLRYFDSSDDNDYSAPRWSEDGKHVFSLTHKGIWQFSLDGTVKRNITEGCGDRGCLFWLQPSSHSVWTRDKATSFFAAFRDRKTRKEYFTRVDMATGKSVDVWEFEGTCYVGHGIGYFALTADCSTVYIVTECSHQPCEIYRFDAAENPVKPKSIYSCSPDLASMNFSKSRLIDWLGTDGKKRRGALILPPDYVEGQRVQVVVDLYEGSQSGFLNNFGFRPDLLENAHFYASQGYAFFLPDLFMAERDNMRQFALELMPAVNKLIELGIADPDRIALLGHSYGGYAVLSVLTQMNRFKTGICISGLSNLTSAYGLFLGDDGQAEWGLFEKDQGNLGGTLWEKRQGYIENSPLFYMDRINCPVLIACGTKDYSANEQSEEAYNALRRLGRRVELRKYVGEIHCCNEWSQETWRDLMNRILEWLERYL